MTHFLAGYSSNYYDDGRIRKELIYNLEPLFSLPHLYKPEIRKMGAGEKEKEKRNEEMYIGRLLENSSPISEMTGIVRRVKRGSRHLGEESNQRG